MTSSSRSTSPPRARLPLIYFALAAFDLLTVLLSLYLITRIANLYVRSVEDNAQQAQRLNAYSHLSQLAAEANAPGNNAFETRDQLKLHERTLASARARFDEHADVVRAELAENGTPEMRARFESVERAMREMTAAARDVFSQLRLDNTELAGERMAAMDRLYAEINRDIATIAREAEAQQQAVFAEQAGHAATLRAYELLVVILLGLMVCGVTFYGLRLARQAKEEARRADEDLRQLAESEVRLEKAVADRSAQLTASYEKLELAERMAAIGTLAAGLGHDMNNVLFPVRCRLQALGDTDVDDHVRDEIGAVNNSVDYLLQLSEGLRLLSLDPDGQSSRPRTSISDWWAEVDPLFRTALPKGRLEADLPERLPAIGVAPHRLTQAIFNLLVNAGEAMGEGGCARIWAESDARTVRIGVTDDGHGMPDEVRQHALDPFFTTKKRGLSTGLGLALVQGVATAAGGRVEIDSVVGRGTTVTMVLPVAADLAPGGARVRSAAVSIADRRQASFVTALLRSAGCDVTPAPPTSEPPRADLWIADPAAVSNARARAFLDSSPGKRIIVVGMAPPVEGVITADPAGGVGAIRGAIEAALLERPEDTT